MLSNFASMWGKLTRGYTGGFIRGYLGYVLRYCGWFFLCLLIVDFQCFAGLHHSLLYVERVLVKIFASEGRARTVPGAVCYCSQHSEYLHFFISIFRLRVDVL